MLKRWLCFFLMVGLVFFSLVAAKPTNALPHISFDTHQRPVEQQTPGGATQSDRALWVVNNTSCSWDADDNLAGKIIGRWPKGYTVSYTDCVIGDWTPHLIFIVSDLVTATLTVDGAPISITNTGCIIGPDYDNNKDNPLLFPISNSNGGVGKVHTITWSAINSTGKPLNQAGIIFGLSLPFSNSNGSGSIESWCGVETSADLLTTEPGVEPRWWWTN